MPLNTDQRGQETRNDLPHTGERAAIAGMYKTEYHTPCGGAERTIHMIIGREFPPCPHCHFRVVWTLIQPD